MMSAANINKITRFLNSTLRIKEIKDSSRNGTQVKACTKINKIGFAVDACLSTFDKAKKQKCDLLIVHHGLLWKGAKDTTGLIKKRIQFLRKNKISLYAVHLPLDKHEIYGNNAQLCNILDLKRLRPFGSYNGVKIGFAGYFKKPVSINHIAKKLNRRLNTKCRNLSFGRKKIRSIAIVSGGGASEMNQSLKYDCFLTGEIMHHIYHEAKDLNHNIMVAGHYATETVGVKALMNLIEKAFKVKVVFIDNPTKT